MDFKFEMLKRIKRLGSDIERMKSDILGLEKRLGEINGYIDEFIRFGEGVIAALKILGKDVYGELETDTKQSRGNADG